MFDLTILFLFFFFCWFMPGVDRRVELSGKQQAMTLPAPESHRWTSKKKAVCGREQFSRGLRMPASPEELPNSQTI
jgi:hypothetical protein